MKRDDVRLFWRHLPAVAAAAVLAELVGAVGSAAVREAVGISGTGSTAVAERVVFSLFAVPVAAVVLSRSFTCSWWSGAEAVVALVGVSLSYWLGPLVWAVVDGVLQGVAGSPWIALRTRNELVHDPFWAIGMLIALAPAELWVWTETGPKRTHKAYGRFATAVKGKTASDPVAVRDASRALANLHRVQTQETTALVHSVDAWARIWFEAEGRSRDDELATQSAVTFNEMENLYGRARPMPERGPIE